MRPRFFVLGIGYGGFSAPLWRSRWKSGPANHHAWRKRALELHYTTSRDGIVDFVFGTWRQLRAAFASCNTIAGDQVLSIFAGGKIRAWLRA